METVLSPPPAGPSPPPPPRRLFTSSLNFICATLAGMRTLEKKKKEPLALNPAAAPEEPAMWHQATAKGKKVLLATQTWRNSSDMPVSRSNPTFLLSPAEHPDRQPQALGGGRQGALGECEGGRQQSPPGK